MVTGHRKGSIDCDSGNLLITADLDISTDDVISGSLAIVSASSSGIQEIDGLKGSVKCLYKFSLLCLQANVFCLSICPSVCLRLFSAVITEEHLVGST